MVGAAHNDVLTAIYADLREVIRGAIAAELDAAGARPYVDHAPLVEAMRARDGAQAAAEDRDRERGHADRGQALLPRAGRGTTGVYSMALTLGASLAAAVPVPLAEALAGWRVGLGPGRCPRWSRRPPGWSSGRRAQAPAAAHVDPGAAAVPGQITRSGAPWALSVFFASAGPRAIALDSLRQPPSLHCTCS